MPRSMATRAPFPTNSSARRQMRLALLPLLLLSTVSALPYTKVTLTNATAAPHNAKCLDGSPVRCTTH